MRILIASLAVATLFVGPAAHAQRNAPLAVGDEWVYRQTVEEPGKPLRTAAPRFQANYANKAGKLVVGVTSSDTGGQTPLWHTAYIVDPDTCFLDVIGGKPLKTQASCVLPAEGQSWQFSEKDSVTGTDESYRVVGRETIQVGAGTFQAWKIDGTRTVSEVVYPGVSTPPAAPKRSHTVYWFAPEAKAMVKVVRERLDPAGALLSRQVEELQRYGTAKKS